MEVQCCFSCSVVLKKLSSSSVIFFPSFFKLHSCGHLRHACMYWLLQYFESVQDISLNSVQRKCWCFVWITSATFLNNFCYLSQLLFKEWSMYCMKTLWPISLSLNKLQGNRTYKALFCLPDIYFSNNFFYDPLTQQKNKSIFYHC